MNEKPPKQVQEARYRDDRKALSAMGRKGAKVAAENRELQRILKQEMIDEAARAQAKLLSISPEGDVLPPEPDTTDEKE